MNKLKNILAKQFSFSVLLACVLSPLGLLANLPPIAVSDQHYTYKNETVYWTVADNDSDPNGDLLTYSVLVPPPANKGTWNLNADGTYEFIPFPFTWGPVNMTYQVCDPGGLCATATLTMYVIFINDVPIINNDNFYVPGNAPFQGNVSANDIEPDGEVLFYSVMLQPSHGTLVMGQFGAFTYTPQNGYQGPDQFIVNGCDPCQACFNSTTFITVGPPNSAPVASAASFSGLEDTQITGSLNAFASDANNDPLVFTNLVSPASGNLTISSNGSFVFTPAANFFGTLNAVYQACDPFGGCASAQITFTVNPVNDPPICQDDFFTGNEDEVLQGSVALNDSDPDGDILNYALVSPPAFGVLSVNPQGAFTYTPPAHFFGSVQAVYSATDPAGAGASATLFITVVSVNDAPVCQDVVVSINKNSVFTGNVSFNDFDADDAVLTYQVLTGPQNGVLQMQPNGNCVYTPNYNYFGTETMTYRATDSQGAFDEAQLIVHVIFTDSGPEAQPDFYTTAEDTPISGNVSLNDTEPDDETMLFVLTTQPQNGMILFNSDGSFTYTPNPNFNGSDQMNYVVTDPAGNSDTSVLTIAVSPVNDAPVCTSQTANGSEDQLFTGQISASDVDGDILNYSVVFPVGIAGNINASTGNFSFLPSPDFFGPLTVSFVVSDPAGTQCSGTWSIQINPVNDAPVCSDNYFSGLEDVMMTGNVSENDFDVDDATLNYQVMQMPASGVLTLSSNGAFTFMPTANFNGQLQAVYRATDAAGAWDEATVYFDIAPVNDAPIAVAQTFNMFWNESLAGVFVASDVDGDALTYQLNSSPTNGTLEWGVNGNFIYTPFSNFFGVEVLSVNVCDGAICTSAALTINVFSENVVPVAVDDFATGLEDEILMGNVSLNDFDLNNDVLTYSLLQSPLTGDFSLSPGGAFIFEPAPNWFGTAEVVYQVCDPQGSCAVGALTIEIQSVNDAPIAINGSLSIDEDNVLTATLGDFASDVDGDALTFSVVSTTNFGTFVLQPGGGFSFSPITNYNGTSTMTWQVCDNSGACALGVLTLLVNPVNDAPIANDDIKVISEDTMGTGNVKTNDYDPDGDPLSASVISGPANGTINLNSTTGAYTYIPVLNFKGTDTVVYQVCDPSGLCSTATLVITVLSMNDTPVAAPDYLVINHNQSGTGDLSANDYDVDIEPLIYTALNGPFNGTLALDTNGTFVYTPNFNFVGTDMVTYMACDTCNACAVSNLFITINFFNNPPLAENDFFTMGKNTTLTGSVADNDSDAQNDPLTFTLVNNTTNGVITLETDGSFIFVPNMQFFGSVVLTYNVCDVNNACTQGTLTIQVLNVNSPPIFTAPVLLSCAGNSTEIHLEDCVADAESPFSIITFQNISSTSGQAFISSDGNLVYQPEEDFTGPVSIFFEVCDNDIEMPLCTSTEISFEVNPMVGEVTLTDVISTDVLCHGDSSGSLTLFADPVVADVFAWSNGAGTAALNNLAAGTYAVVISSSSVCLLPLEAEFEISEPDAPITVTGLEALPINSSAGGSTTYTVTGGTEPYTFVWTNGLGEVVSQNQVLDGLVTADLQGAYFLNITDANGCEYTDTILVTGIYEQNGNGIIAVYPNPSSGLFRFAMPTFAQSVRLSVHDASGRLVRQESLSGASSFDLDLAGEASGYYTFLLSADNSIYRGVLVVQ